VPQLLEDESGFSRCRTVPSWDFSSSTSPAMSRRILDSVSGGFQRGLGLKEAVARTRSATGSTPAAENPKPLLNGQVHPTASSKSSRQRIINRIRFLAYPPVTSPDPFGKMAPLFRKLFSRAVTILEMTRASAPEGRFGWLNQSLLS
jgi:hypothetical protein